MPLDIKDPRTEQLAREVESMTGESRSGAIRVALQERKARLEISSPTASRERALRAWLADSVWRSLPDGTRGHVLTRSEQDERLGYDEQGS